MDIRVSLHYYYNDENGYERDVSRNELHYNCYKDKKFHHRIVIEYLDKHEDNSSILTRSDVFDKNDDLPYHRKRLDYAGMIFFYSKEMDNVVCINSEYKL